MSWDDIFEWVGINRVPELVFFLIFQLPNPPRNLGMVFLKIRKNKPIPDGNAGTIDWLTWNTDSGVFERPAIHILEPKIQRIPAERAEQFQIPRSAE